MDKDRQRSGLPANKPMQLRSQSGSISARAFSSEVDASSREKTPVRVKKMRQNKNLEPRSDSVGTETALGQHELSERRQMREQKTIG
jgi:hypothetical protein